MKVALICSSGGHLLQLYQLKPWWEGQERFWVTFDKPDARSLLGGEEVVWAHHPTTRNIPNMFRNLALAWRVLSSRRPDLVISNGAGVAFPFFLVAKLLGIKTVYIEVYDRIDLPTVTGKLCYPLSDLFLLQWEEQRRWYPKGRVIGKLLGEGAGMASVLNQLGKIPPSGAGQGEAGAAAGLRAYDIFVTVGTDHHPFDRLVRWVDEWLATEGRGVTCFMQTGTSRVPRHADWRPYLAYEEMVSLMASARVVVCHGGPGTVMLSLALGKKPIVVPRHRSLGEHVDDHQVKFCRRAADRGDLYLAEDEEAFRLVLRQNFLAAYDGHADAGFEQNGVAPDGIGAYSVWCEVLDAAAAGVRGREGGTLPW